MVFSLFLSLLVLFVNGGKPLTKGQLKTLGTQMGYPIGVPFRVIQKHKGTRIIDDIVKFVNN